MRRVLSEIFLWAQVLYENVGPVAVLIGWGIVSGLAAAAAITAILLDDWLMAVVFTIVFISIIAISRHEVKEKV